MKYLGQDKVEILWTGGYDSTFMLFLLAYNYNVKIQPYYLDMDRNIRDREVKAIKKIFSFIKNDKLVRDKVLSPKFIDSKYFVTENDVENAFNVYKESPYLLGSQIMYLAQFAKKHKGICFGQQRYSSVPGHMWKLLTELGHMEFNDKIGYLKKEKSEPFVYTLFGNFTLPIITYSNLMMAKMIKEWGLEEVFANVTWCYQPVHEKPCGVCYPCRIKISQGLTYLFDDEALKRNHVWKMLKEKENKLDFVWSGKQAYSLSEIFEMYCCEEKDDNVIRSIKKSNSDKKTKEFLIKNYNLQFEKYYMYFEELLKNEKNLGLFSLTGSSMPDVS